VAVNVKAGAGMFASAEQAATFRNTDEKWKEQREPASFPVDMSRVVTVDKYMPAILQNEINSELGGKVVAQVEENVFGGHGRNILIPAGSKAIGRYKPLTKVGQERLEIVWVRIITPDGINIHTGNAEMTDAMGRAGLTGKVDRRYGERYGMSLLVSMVTAATTYSIPVQNTNEQVVVESFGKEQGSLAKAILEEHLDIKPRVTVPAGSRILITAARDIWFKMPEKNQVNVVPLEDKNS
jgi:type IV secretory pathway VirB10-like protein